MVATYLLLACRNVIAVGGLILYVETLLNLLIRFGNSFVNCWVSCVDMSLTVRSTFIFFSLYDFLSVCPLVAVGTISNTVLNESTKSKHPCLVLKVREKDFSLSPLSTMLAIGF